MSWYKAYSAEAVGVHPRPGSAGDLTAMNSGPPGLRPLSSRGEAVPAASNGMSGLSGHLPAAASSPGAGSRSGMHPPPMPSEIEELEPLLSYTHRYTPHQACQLAPGPSAASTDLLSVWGQTWAGSTPKQQRILQRRLVPGGNLDVIISKWNAAWDGAPAKAHQQHLQQPAPANTSAGPVPSCTGSHNSSSTTSCSNRGKCNGNVREPVPMNLRLRKPGAAAPNSATCSRGDPASSSSRGRDAAAMGTSGATGPGAGSTQPPPCSPRSRPSSPGSSSNSSGRRSPLAALNITHPHSPALGTTPRLLATAAAAAAATAVLARRPWWRNRWWLAGGLGVAVTSASAVGAAYLVLAYFVKAAAVFSMAWKAATGVAAAEGLCLGSWSYGQAAAKDAAAEALTVSQQQHIRDVAALQVLLKVEEARRTEAVTGLVALQQALLAKVDSLSTCVAAPCLNASSMAAAANAGVSALGRGQAVVQEQVSSLAASQQQLLTMMCDVKEELLSLQACPIPHVVTTPRGCETPSAAVSGAACAPTAAAAAGAGSSHTQQQVPPPAAQQRAQRHHHHHQQQQDEDSSSSSSVGRHLAAGLCVELAPSPAPAAALTEEEDLLAGACDIQAYSSACSLRRRSIRRSVDAAVDAAVQSVFR